MKKYLIIAGLAVLGILLVWYVSRKFQKSDENLKNVTARIATNLAKTSAPPKKIKDVYEELTQDLREEEDEEDEE